MYETTILGVKLNNRMNTAHEFQSILSTHGCQIKSRIGLHQVEDGVCSPSGVILLEVIGDESQLEKDLLATGNVEIQKIKFPN